MPFLTKPGSFARERGLQSIELQVNAENQAAYAMYRSCGFTDQAIRMELPL